MLVKLYGPTHGYRYSPGELLGIEKTWVMGKPDEKLVSTSFAERQNLTMRMNIRRLTRLTNAHSKKFQITSTRFRSTSCTTISAASTKPCRRQLVGFTRHQQWPLVYQITSGS